MKQFIALIAIIGMIACPIIALENFKLDLTAPINRIRNQIDATRVNAPIWSKIPEILAAVLPCLTLTPPELDTSGLLPDLETYLKQTNPAALVKEIGSLVNWDEVSMIKSAKQADENLLKDIKAYMATPGFAAVHKHLWSHPEFLDLIGFIYNGGFINIYEQFIYFYEYMEREDLSTGDTPIPTQPPTYTLANNARGARTGLNSGPPPFPFQLKSPIVNTAAATCNILKILDLIQTSKLMGVLNIFMYALEEVAGDPAMHVMLLKLGEKQKGDFIKATLELPQMREFLPLIQRVLLSEQWIQQLNFILHEVTGLSLGNFELFAYIVKVIQYLIWGHPF